MEADIPSREDDVPSPDDAAGQDQDEAYVEEVDDGITMGTDDNSYSYWLFLRNSVVAYVRNPWVLLILAYIAYKIYNRIQARYINPLLERFDAYREQKRVEAEAASIKKNPDQYLNKMEAMEAARAKLQQQYDQTTKQWQIRKTEQEEKKRQQEIEDWENHQQGKGYKNRRGAGVDKEREALEQQAKIKGKKGFKPDYNPLMGMGGGSSFRPSRRAGASGGG